MSIVPYTKSLEKSTIECLCRSFEEDPLFNALVHYEYDKYSEWMFSTTIWLLQSYKLSECIIDSNGKVLCASIWEPAKPSFLVLLKYIVALFHTLRILGWRKMMEYIRIVDECERKRKKYAPTALHLQTIGTDSSSQGKGLGSKILKYGIKRADDLGLSCYLESSNPRNVPFYERYGFKTVELYYPFEKDKRFNDKGPVCTIMLREYSA